ncbi:threonine-phosphate decarboxylase [Marinimicrobium locisalis]|uniref:threonine-phosphate decarboxylase n=1 Tax=Marinimicrobium locisalis TaxID=546022 RepID=UPI0032220325
MMLNHLNHTPATDEPHGGDLKRARALVGEGDWEDLSTGISPWPWPVPEVPMAIWQRLPERGGALSEAAANYYGVGAERVLALPGSQFGIARLPCYVPPGRVAVPAPGYAEHARAWRAAGHTVVTYHHWAGLDALVEAGSVDHLVLINPNNPTAEYLPLEALRRWLTQLPSQSVVLVDEAFADLTPECSVVPLLDKHSSLWVLRSVGKFFGLAGLRLGFLLGPAHHPVRRSLESELMPWGVSHLAQWVGAGALSDTPWQQGQRERLGRASRELEALWRDYLARRLPEVTVANGGLFVTLRGPGSVLHGLHEHLANQRLWLRLGADAEQGAAWLRCGLPPDGGARLAEALAVAKQ